MANTPFGCFDIIDPSLLHNSSVSPARFCFCWEQLLTLPRMTCPSYDCHWSGWIAPWGDGLLSCCVIVTTDPCLVCLALWQQDSRSQICLAFFQPYLKKKLISRISATTEIRHIKTYNYAALHCFLSLTLCLLLQGLIVSTVTSLLYCCSMSMLADYNCVEGAAALWCLWSVISGPAWSNCVEGSALFRSILWDSLNCIC